MLIDVVEWGVGKHSFVQIHTHTYLRLYDVEHDADVFLMNHLMKV
jgi:hypothetical protein